MADGWFVEQGIGEHRAIRIVGDRIVAARIEWTDRVAAGWVVEATLASRAAGSARGTAVTDTGEEVLVSALPRQASEGSTIRVEITRASLTDPGRHKRAQGRWSVAPLVTNSLAERLDAQVVRRFPIDGWDDALDEALSASVPFPGGTLLFAPTPAMTTVDIDGDLPPRALALAAVAPLAKALTLFDLAGSIVIDFPTLPAKDDRRAVDAALAVALADWPHERTAMNGFGLVQLVARMERPSLLHLATWQRSRMVWHRLLRRAEALEGAGTMELAIHPALETVASPKDVAALERRAGMRVHIRKAATLALEAPQAQIIANA